MNLKVSSWKSIFKYSSFQFAAKGTFGIASNIIFYNIFGPIYLASIKIVETLIGLPQFLNIGISNSLILEASKESKRARVISNFIIIKLFTVGTLIAYIAFDKYIFNIFENFTFFETVLIVAVLASSVLYNFSVNLNFIDGKIHLKPFINSIVITLTPFLHISLGYYFLVKGWLIFTIFISLLPTFYLLKNNSIDLKDEFSFKYFDTQQIKALFNKMPLYFFNIKFLYITEIFVFFFLAKNIGLLQSGALAFFFRIILMFSKLVGEVFQKKFFWQNISEKNNISFKDSSIKRIIYLSLLISVAIFIMIPGLHLLIDYILPKYTIVIEFVSLAGIIIFSELICGDILRRLFIKQVNSTLLKILIVNISLHAIFFSYIYNTELTLNQIALCLSCLWLVKFIFVTSISLKPSLEYLFLLFLIFTISIYSLLFSFISDLYYFLSFENMYIFLLLILMFISCLSIFLYLTKKKFV